MKTRFILLSVSLLVASAALVHAQIAPAIVNPPQPQSITLGATATLAVTATGTAPLGYQWRQGGLAIAGATNATLTLAAFNEAAAAVYDVVVRNATGSVTSPGALLTVRRVATIFPVAATASDEAATGAAGGRGVYLVGIRGDASSPQNATVQLISADGALVNSRLAAGSSSGMGPIVAHDGSNFLLVWDSAGSSLRGQIVSAAGTQAGGPFLVATVNPKSYRVSFGGGRYLVCWTVDGAVFGQWVMPTGTLSGGSFAIAAAPLRAWDCAVAFNGTHFLVVWAGGAGNFRPNIYGQLVSPTGALIGGTLLIDDNAAPSDNPMAVASNGTDFFVIWNDEVGSGATAAWDLVGCMVSGAGVVQPTRLVISSDPGSQQFPSLAYDGTNYLAAWSERPDSGTGNIVYRFFNPTGQPIGAAFTVFTTAAGNQPLFGGIAFGGTRYLAFTSYGTWSTGSEPVIRDVYAALLPTSWDVSGPQITTHPVSQTIAAGANITLAVAATGTPPPTFQWHKNGGAVPGATNATLTLNSVQASDAGSYFVVASNPAGSVTSDVATLSLAASSSRLTNLSILTSLANAGDNFTLGYVVGGSGTSGTKPLVLRAAGPSLGALGVPGTLDDPRIELFAGSVQIGGNDNWGGATNLANAMTAVGAFAYTGPTSRDAAAALSVAKGDNSIRVSAAGNGTGAVIAEIYDATPMADFTLTTPRLVNVSVLKPLGSGFTVGFVVGGSGAKSVLVRAIGPTLGSAFNLSGALNDPQLTLYSGQTALGSNDNWGGTTALRAAFSTAGAFALADASRDAAAVVSLQPGNYTVVVSGVGNATGVVLVEVYELNP